MSKASKKRQRIKIDANEETAQILESLRQKTGSASNTETVRHAVRAYDWLVKIHQEKWEILLRRNNEERSVEIPIL